MKKGKDRHRWGEGFQFNEGDEVGMKLLVAQLKMISVIVILMSVMTNYFTAQIKRGIWHRKVL